MNKRTFMKLGSAALMSPIVRPLLTWAGAEKLTNWAGNIVYSTQQQLRPHWGKLFTISPVELRSRYQKLPEFVELSRSYDSAGKFPNKFLRKYVFGNLS